MRSVEEIVRQLQETDSIHIDDGEARLFAANVTVPDTINDVLAKTGSGHGHLPGGLGNRDF